MFLVALFTKAQNPRQPSCPPIGEWLNKLWYAHAVEHCATIKGNELLTYGEI